MSRGERGPLSVSCFWDIIHNTHNLNEESFAVGHLLVHSGHDGMTEVHVEENSSWHGIQEAVWREEQRREGDSSRLFPQ